MSNIGYVRCSTDRQTVIQQEDALRTAGCVRIFRDEGVKATAPKRPGLLAARKALKPGDTFVVWAIDRAFRSTMEAILFLDDVMLEGITFRSLTQHIDTRTPEGRKWYIDTASWAEYERAVISRRTRLQMAAAKKRGKVFGRPRLLSERDIARARELLEQSGLKREAVANRFNVSPRTLSRALSACEASCRG